MSTLKVGDSVRISDQPSTTPEPADEGHGYVQREVAGRTGVIKKLDPADSVHLVVVRSGDGGWTKAWIHEAHLTPVVTP